jgi:hypothetical protein
MQAAPLLLLAALAMTFGVSPGWAQVAGSKTAPPSATASQFPARKTAKTTPAKSAKTPAQHKGATTASTHASSASAGKRDPFKLPEFETAKAGLGGGPMLNGAGGGVLPPGARGLLISQLKLEGVVRQNTANKMIAVVTNDTKRAYFLTENESVYNGVVSKITPDSVYFKENVLDVNGRVTTREVVKKLNPAPGEGR